MPRDHNRRPLLERRADSFLFRLANRRWTVLALGGYTIALLIAGAALSRC